MPRACRHTNAFICAGQSRRLVGDQCAPMFESSFLPRAKRQTMCPLCKEPVKKVSIVYQ